MKDLCQIPDKLISLKLAIIPEREYMVTRQGILLGVKNAGRHSLFGNSSNIRARAETCLCPRLSADEHYGADPAD